jgi:hypothetical protein
MGIPYDVTLKLPKRDVDALLLLHSFVLDEERRKAKEKREKELKAQGLISEKVA